MSENTKIMLGLNQYGKAEVRLVKVTRGTKRHEIEDLNITSLLKGDFSTAYLEGDNSHIIPTDTQKNTIYALGRQDIGTPEEFLLRISEHFISSFDWIQGGSWGAESYAWDRIEVSGIGHDHSFVRNNRQIRTAAVIKSQGNTYIIGGLRDLTVLKTTESGFVGFSKDKFTTLQETTDRILSTEISARWRYNITKVDFDKVYDGVKNLLLEGFAEKYSAALQRTLFEMGKKVLEAYPQIDEIRLSMPNKHHFLVDLSPFGLDNPNEVFFAADRPYGLIEASVLRENISSAEDIWNSITDFC